MSLEFFYDIKSFLSHYGPVVDSASNRNEYQEYFPGGKGGRCVRLTNLPPSCAVVMKSGNLNFLETSGPLQASNGTDLPFIWYKFMAAVYVVSCLKSGNLNFLEPSGPLQACSGTALPFINHKNPLVEIDGLFYVSL